MGVNETLCLDRAPLESRPEHETRAKKGRKFPIKIADNARAHSLSLAVKNTLSHSTASLRSR